MANTQSNQDIPRWIYRFNNYKRAFILLREAIEILQERELSQLEKEGIIQRFEYTWELAWKVLKDYIEFEGIILEKITSAAVIKAAFSAKIITDGEGWMKILDSRNKMSHTYNFKDFEKTIIDIKTHHLALLDTLHFKLLKISLENSKNV